MELNRSIAVVGCGAVGSYYGARLASSGHRAHFLLRSDWEAVSRNGVAVHSPLGDFTARPIPARTPEEIGPCDLVLVALKTTANHELERLVRPLVSERTVVITLQNGLGNEEALARFVAPHQVMGGLCFVCLNRTAPGVVKHMAYGQVVLGEFKRRNDSELELLAEMFRRTGVPCSSTPNLGQARWEKLVWNIPFNGLGVASTAGFDALAGEADPAVPPGVCLTTDKLISDPRWEGMVCELMQEVIAAARAEGHPVEDALMEKLLGLTRSMGAYKSSTLLDFEHRQPLELETMFLEPLRRARRAGLAVPRLGRLCAVLEALERQGDRL